MTKNTNEMKANELMIGDWVRTEAGALIVAGVGPKIYCRANDGNPTHLWEVTSIEPIPLTAEILEKNGFRVRSSWAEYEDDDCTIELFGANISIKNGRGPWVRGKWSFVHELQHALRLCGIDKEIEL